MTHQHHDSHRRHHHHNSDHRSHRHHHESSSHGSRSGSKHHSKESSSLSRNRHHHYHHDSDEKPVIGVPTTTKHQEHIKGMNMVPTGAYDEEQQTQQQEEEEEAIGDKVAVPIPIISTVDTNIAAPNTITKTKESAPPPQVAQGGTWGYVIHLGEQTMLSAVLCCVFAGGLIPAAVIWCLPFDKKRAYLLGNAVYDEYGNRMSNTRKDTFQKEDPFHPGADNGRCVMSFAVSACVLVSLVVTLVLIMFRSTDDDGQ